MSEAPKAAALKPNTFVIPEDSLQLLRATHQGRISLGGFNYQASFAIARMAAMAVRSEALDLDGVPTHLRYDWGEDLDERWVDSTVCFTQCKKVGDIGQPASLAGILLGFAPKLLWAQADDQAKICFRLVCTDPLFSRGGTLRDSVSDSRNAIRKKFLEKLSLTPEKRSDRAIWQDAADSFDHEALFDALWDRTEANYVPDTVLQDHVAGPVLPAEREALRLLLESPAIGIEAERQRESIARLRNVLHENLIAFDPASDETLDLNGLTPRIIRREDVTIALFSYRHHEGKRLPFHVVDQAFLRDHEAKAKTEFVARPPEWADVLHGTDADIKFLERDQTLALQEAILDDLIEPLRHGTTQRLAAKFVLGPPGSGKSTIVRRAVAKLVQEGRVVAADPGVYLDNADDLRRFCDKLNALAIQGKPVLLVLDDPLYADSTWPELLRQLARPSSQVAVLAASPTFLYDRYKSQLRGRIQRTEFQIAAPSDAERLGLDRLYGYESNGAAEPEDDFLVLAMQRAAGASFDEIIRRLWETLNGGQPLSPDTAFEDYPWEIRAFLVTCFFHRNYLPCPEPMLRVILERTGGITPGRSIADALRQLTHQKGWAIFRIKAPEVHPSFAFVGNQISASHKRIAERAWALRPAEWRPLNDQIVQGTLDAPESIRAASQVAAELDRKGEHGLADDLVDAWASPERATREICDLHSTLSQIGCIRPADKLCPILNDRATAISDGWLAALALWFASGSSERERSFPPTLDLKGVISAADFSIAPLRSVGFATRLQTTERVILRERLIESLKGKLDWALDSFLLTWLIATSQISEAFFLEPQVVKWLNDHLEDTAVRTQYLTYLMKLPDGQFEKERRQAAADTAKWLNDHPHATDVRTQYLAYLMKLPDGQFEKERQQAAADTAQWLDEHPDVTDVRTQYLTYLMKLPDGQFEKERQQAAADTAQWLDSNAGTTNIRIAFAAFAAKVAEVDSPIWSRIEGVCLALVKELSRSFDVRHIYGNYLLKATRFSEAADQFQESLRIHKGHVASRLGLAAALKGIKDYPGAESALEHALWWAKKNLGATARIYSELGWLHVDQQRWEEARSDFQAAAAEVPDYFGNHWGIGRAEFELGHYHTTEKSLRRALSNDDLKPPASDEVQSLLAQCLAHLEK